jgi:hypothetical protein
VMGLYRGRGFGPALQFSANVAIQAQYLGPSILRREVD